MAVRAADIDGEIFEFACSQWDLMSDASKADWTVVENTCGFQTSVGSPYAASDFLFTLNGVVSAAFPLSISVVDGVYTIGLDANSDLNAVEELTGTGIAVRTADNTWALRTLVEGTGIDITNADGVAGNITITNSAPDQVVALTAGSGISITGTYPNFTISSTGGTNYQTLRDGGVDMAQRAAANFLDSARVSFSLADDAVNGETEIAADIVTNSVGNTHIRQSAGLSVIGRSSNTTGDVADIAAGTDGHVLRRSGTAIGFGQVATAGIEDDAVTLAKLLNAVSNNVVLGNISGAGAAFAELTVANLYTLLGITGTANRFALFTGPNTLTTDAAFTFDGANDRATFTGTATGVGANTGILNLNSGALGAATTFLRMSGNISSNMIAELTNANNATVNANSLFTISVGGASAGDPVVQFTVSGAVTHSIGTDNSDSDKFKVTTNSATPGGNANASFVITNEATPKHGFNVDAPGRDHDFSGVIRAKQLVLQNAVPTVTMNAANGAGVGGNATIEGCNNGFRITINTGTAPVANAAILTVTFLQTFTTSNYPVFVHGNVAAANEFTKFVFDGYAPGTIKLKANGTLTASTTYVLNFVAFGL